MRMKIVLVVLSSFTFLGISVSGIEDFLEIDRRFWTHPPVITENLILNSTQQSITIRHGAYLHNALKPEHTLWIIKNEVPDAIGFKITVVEIDLDHRGDTVEVTRDNCQFKDSIYYPDDGPIIHLGDTVNIEFYKTFTGLGHGFKIEVSSIHEGEESPCPGVTEISMDNNSGQILVADVVKPQDRYGDHEHIWRIKSNDPNAVGFKITFNNTNLVMWEDKLNISGQDCIYEFTNKNYNMENQSRLPPLEVTGSWMTVHLKLHSLEINSNAYEDLVFSIDLLHDSNKSDCSVCESANAGDYCDGELCNCTARFSYCDERKRVCSCGDGTVFENGKCQTVYHCDDNNACISHHGGFGQTGTMKSWNDSQSICEEDGGRLVHITTDLFYEYVLTTSASKQSVYYIGSVEGDVGNWVYDYPTEGCPILHMNLKKLHNVKCNIEAPFICEKLST